MFFSESAVWGHRGWPSRYPDNSEAGIRAAAGVAAGVEIDIRATADGQLALSHDPELAGRVVCETSWADLAALRVGGHPPARLDDVVDVGVPLDLEVKNDPDEPDFDPTHRVGRQVADRARPGDILTSFWWPTVDAVRESHPDVSTGLLLWGPMDPRDAVRRAVDRGHRVVAPERSQVTEELVALVRSEGLQIVTWTVDDVAEAARLAALGVDAIISNRPGELIESQGQT
ncbi:MAG: glycerophosphodiester phosphodiesterase [Acidimicrobiia bacterium]|nr:glycerophosphodiester phosphodiesterase [Acidimicrobiia bacterium]